MLAALDYSAGFWRLPWWTPLALLIFILTLALVFLIWRFFRDRAEDRALYKKALTVMDDESDPCLPLENAIADLGWTPEEAARVRASMASFEEMWDAPGMEAYDKIQPDSKRVDEADDDESACSD